LGEPGRRFSGRSMLRPYGIVTRQGTREPCEKVKRAGRSQRTLGESPRIHETAPALRNPDLAFASFRASIVRRERAPVGHMFGTAIGRPSIGTGGRDWE